jgi:cell division septum initiation protein DivIVA
MDELLLKQENEELKKRVAELEEHLKKYTAPFI